MCRQEEGGGGVGGPHSRPAAATSISAQGSPEMEGMRVLLPSAGWGQPEVAFVSRICHAGPVRHEKRCWSPVGHGAQVAGILHEVDSR